MTDINEVIEGINNDFNSGGKWQSLDDEEWIPLKVSKWLSIKKHIEEQAIKIAKQETYIIFCEKGINDAKTINQWVSEAVAIEKMLGDLAFTSPLVGDFENILYVRTIKEYIKSLRGEQ